MDGSRSSPRHHRPLAARGKRIGAHGTATLDAKELGVKLGKLERIEKPE